MVWLQGSLEHAKLSIKKLQKLFGIIPRIRKKHRKNKGDEENKSSTEDDDKDDEGGTGSASNDTLVNENATENSSVVSKNAVVAYLARNIKMLKRSQYPTRTSNQAIYVPRYVAENSIA